MPGLHQYFEALYHNFNDREIDLVIANMSSNVKWANGMEGGYLHGRDAVREYWTRQFGLINSKVVPLQVEGDRDMIKIKVHQVVHDLNGNLLADEIIEHYFQWYPVQIKFSGKYWINFLMAGKTREHYSC